MRGSLRERGSKRWGEALPALLYFGLLAAAIHAGARRLGFVGDSWTIFLEAASGWREALGTPLGYHYIPLAGAWVRVLHLFLGDREVLYALANIAELAAVGWLTFRLGRRLLGESLPGLLAGSLLIASAAFPDITYWPLVGNFHCLAVAFAIGAISAAARLAEDDPPLGTCWRFAVAFAAACFTYEGTFTLLPVAIVWFLVRAAERGGARSLWRRETAESLFRRFAPSLPALAALIFAKIYFSRATASAVSPAIDFERLHSLAQSLLGIFTLRSSTEVLENLLYLGTTPMALVRTRILLVLAVALLVGAWTFRRARRGAALLVLWLAIHLGAAAVALPLSPRHRFLPSVPGLLLLSFGFCRFGERLARGSTRRIGGGSGRLPLGDPGFALAVPVVLASVLAMSAQGELHRAQELYRRGYDALRLSVERARGLLPSRNTPAVVTLVNGPAYLVEGGIAAPAVDNAVNGLARYRLDGARIELVHTRQAGEPGWIAADGSRWIDQGELERLRADPFRAVVFFELGP